MSGLLKFCGPFHPASTHLPVGLLLAAALAEMLYLWRGHALLRTAAVFNLHLGAVAALSAAVLGWALAATMGIEPELRPTLFWHRWMGTGVAVWSILTVLAWHWLRRPGTHQASGAFRWMLVGGAVLTGIVGHLGGSLVYGLDYYSWPF